MSNQPEKKQNFLTGAAILSISTIVVKVIGMLYKLPLNQIIDSQGFAYFNKAYAIYTVLLVVSTTGLPVAMSRMVSEARARGNGRQMQRIFRTAMTTLCRDGSGSNRSSDRKRDPDRDQQNRDSRHRGPAGHHVDDGV